MYLFIKNISPDAVLFDLEVNTALISVLLLNISKPKSVPYKKLCLIALEKFPETPMQEAILAP